MFYLMEASTLHPLASAISLGPLAAISETSAHGQLIDPLIAIALKSCRQYKNVPVNSIYKIKVMP